MENFLEDTECENIEYVHAFPSWPCVQTCFSHFEFVSGVLLARSWKPNKFIRHEQCVHAVSVELLCQNLLPTKLLTHEIIRIKRFHMMAKAQIKTILVYVVLVWIEIIHKIYAQFAWIIIMHYYYYCSSNDGHNVPGTRRKKELVYIAKSKRTNERRNKNVPKKKDKTSDWEKRRLSKRCECEEF